MTQERTRPVPDDHVHVELPSTQVRGFDRLFATLAEAFDEPEEPQVSAIQHDPGLASSDDYIRDETIAKLVGQFQGMVLFCDHPDCDIYTTDPEDLIYISGSGYFCTKH